MYSPFYVDVYSHGVRLHDLSKQQIDILKPFLDKLRLKELVSYYDRRTRRTVNKLEIKKTFYVLSEEGREVFFHKHMLDDVLTALGNGGLTKYTRRDIPIPVAAHANFIVQEKFKPYPYQEKIIEKLKGDSHTNAVKLPPGKGKTFVALKSVADQGRRLLVMVAPKYFVIWEEALADIYEDTGFTIRKVSGSKALKALIKDAEEGNPIEDVILFSNVTYRNYIDNLERYGSKGMRVLGYTVPPYELHGKLGVGIQVNDECHEDIGLAFRIDCVTNVAKQIYLTATPFSSNDELSRIIRMMLPAIYDAPLPPPDRYVIAIACHYNDPEVTPTDYFGYKGNYSHTKLESTLLEQPKRKEDYYRKLIRVIENVYVAKKPEGTKCLLFFATIAMIEDFEKYLKENISDKTLRINKYIAGTDKSVLTDSDIIVSTGKSAGTGVDIKDLYCVLNTHASNSKPANIQAIGRLRRMKRFPDINPIYIYTVCEQIEAHHRYRHNKTGHFHDRACKHLDLSVR